MKRTLIRTTRLAFLCTALAGGLLTFSNSASAFTIRDAHKSGSVQFGATSRHNDGSSYVNNLIGMLLRSDERSNDFPSDTITPHVVLPDHVDTRNAGGQSGVIITPPSITRVPKPSSAVPDGGITAMLLGAALGALGLTRRYMRTE